LIKHVGVLYHPKRNDAQKVARQAVAILGRHAIASTLLSAWEDESILAMLPNWQMTVTCGGDGTILRIARLAARFGVIQIGVNFGRLGFLAELQPNEVAEGLSRYLNGEYWVEERTMLRATVCPRDKTVADDPEGDADCRWFDGLNEVLVARGALPRVIRVKVAIDGTDYAVLGGDGVAVATATGSTAYSLAAGGPVLSPHLRSMVVTPICPHILRAAPLVLPPEAKVTLEMCSGFTGIISVDGQVDVPIDSGDTVRVATSPHVARFARARSAGYFYELAGRALYSRGNNQ
jgi:NAD+ kinase